AREGCDKLGLVKGDLSIDEPSGQRWDLALDLIESGESGVLIAGRVQISRYVTGPTADGLIHIAVLAGQDTAPSRELAQNQVDTVRAYVSELVSEDRRFQYLMERFGVTWEYVGDDGSASWVLAAIAEDGSRV